MIAKLSPAIGRLRATLGLAGTVGAAFLVAAGCVYAFALLPLEGRLLSINQRLTESRAQSTAQGMRQGLGSMDTEDKLATFYRFFKRPEKPSDWLAHVYAAADANQLDLRVGEYVTAPLEKGGGLQEITMTFPASGSYTQIRSFCESVLNSVPVASLDHITFRRRKASDTSVDAEIRISLFMAED